MTSTTRPPLIVQIPPGDLGTLHSLAAMRAAADRLAARPEPLRVIDVRAVAVLRVAAGVIFHHVRRFYRFTPDPARAELQRDHVQQMRELIDFPHAPQLGDCDDRAVFTAALCQANGIPARFVAVSSNPRRPFHHVYAAAMIHGHPYPLDSQVCSEPGEEPPGIARRYTEGEVIRPRELLDQNGRPYTEPQQ